MKVDYKNEDIYTEGQVVVSMSKAEWIAIRSFAYYYAVIDHVVAAAAAKKLGNGLYPYELQNIDWSKLFNGEIK